MFETVLQTAPNFHSEENPTITYSIPSDLYSPVAAIYHVSGNQSYVPYRAIDRNKTSYTFELTDEEVNNLLRAMGDNNSLPVRFYIRTQDAKGQYWYSYDNTTFYIEKPVIDASVVDVNEKTIALTGDDKKLIRYFSNAKATMEVTARKGATINEDLYIIRNGDYTGYGTTHTFNNVENGGFIFSAEDDKGGIGTATLTPYMVEYVKPTCHIADNKPDALGNMTVACTGKFFNNTFGAVTNTLTAKCRYTLSGNVFSENWMDMQITTNGDSYYAAANFAIPDFSQTQVYIFECKVKDELSEIASQPYRANSRPLFHWGENDFVFEVPVTFNAGTEGAISEGDQTIKGDLRLKRDGENYGTRLRFGDGDYCYIGEFSDDVMTIRAKQIYLVANSGIYVDGYAIPILDKGIWVPSLDSSAISSYTTQYGWYSKIGQTVTVGFYIKATCKSGWDGVNIAISGLPYTSMFSAAGGGMCSGAYVSAGFNFQCFVAEASSTTIKTRVQECNNTAMENLSTSSSGCKYPSGGGELTVSGTITYMSNT